jgi:RNA polymerase sigma-B factor
MSINPSLAPGADLAVVSRREEGQPLSALSERELFEAYSGIRDVRYRNELVLRHERLVRHLAARFQPMGVVAMEDLVQVAFMGLITAIERYDLEAGVGFGAYAAPTILGVIKHYLRDQTWAVKVPRRLRELATQSRTRAVRLEQTLGRPPTIPELAESLGVHEERLLQAMEVGQHYRAASLDAERAYSDQEKGESLLDSLGSTVPEYSSIEEREMLERAISGLDERDQAIIRSRFFEESSQSQVAEKLGISQMHVSRLERRALRQLKDILS